MVYFVGLDEEKWIY